MNETPYYVFYPFIANFGGIERLIVDLARFLDARGRKLVLITFQNTVDFSDYGAPHLQVEEIRSRRNLWAEASALRDYVRRSEIQSRHVLVMEMRGAIYAGLAFAPGYSLHIADPPSLLSRDLSKFSFSIASFYSDLKVKCSIGTRIRGQIVHWLTKRGVCRAGRPVTMTQRNVEELHNAYGVDFAKVPPGVQVPETVTRKADPDGRIRFLSVCRLEPSKRIDSIIRCLAELKKHASTEISGGVMLRIVGEGSEGQTLKNLVKSCNLEADIEFSGFVTDEELENEYAAADVFVMPARQGYGLPGLESLVRGLQLIVHKESGVTEFLADMPQVQVIENFESSLTNAMRRAAAAFCEVAGEPPDVPTSDGWAGRIAEISEWDAQALV